jgi:hypothetical protein
MIKNKCVVASIFIVVLFVAILLSCSSNNTGFAPIQNSGKYYGYIYNQNGSPAKGARVSIVPADYVPKQGLVKKTATDPVIVTDENGRFAIDNISSGTYNLFGEGNGVASYASSVTINDAASAGLIVVDTLRATGNINGVVLLAPQGDSRRILILAIGSNLITTPADSFGGFALNNLAPGNYRLRFLATDPQFPIIDTSITVGSGTFTDIGTLVLSSSPGIKVQQIVITSNEIPGWKLQPKYRFNPELDNASSFNRWDPEGAPAYISHGLVDLAYEQIIKPPIVPITGFDSVNALGDWQYFVQAVIMDFGFDTNALEMYQAKLTEIDTLISIPGYDAGVALATTEIQRDPPPICAPSHGITVYAHLGKFYMELAFDGYSDLSKATSDAKLFLDNIKSKVQ